MSLSPKSTVLIRFEFYVLVPSCPVLVRFDSHLLSNYNLFSLYGALAIYDRY